MLIIVGTYCFRMNIVNNDNNLKYLLFIGFMSKTTIYAKDYSVDKNCSLIGYIIQVIYMFPRNTWCKCSTACGNVAYLDP